MPQNRRQFLTGIGSGIASTVVLSGSVQGKAKAEKSEGFGRPTFVKKEDIKELPYLEDIIDSDALVVSDIGNEYKIRLNKQYWKSRIKYTGELTQKDFENSKIYTDLESKRSEIEEQIEQPDSAITSSTNRGDTQTLSSTDGDWVQTIELGEDQNYDPWEIQTYYDDSDEDEPYAVVSGWGPGGAVEKYTSHVEVLPTGGWGVTWAMATSGIPFKTEGSSSQTATFHLEADYEGYTLGTINNTGSVEIKLRLIDLKHDSQNETTLFEHSLGNADIGTWRSGNETASLTHKLQPDRNYRAELYAKASISVRGSGSSLDFGYKEYNRSYDTDIGIHPQYLDIEF